MRGRLKQGLYPWGAPIGYLNNGGGKPKTPDPKRAPLIKEMFELYASGTHSIRSLQIEMKRRGLRTTTNGIVSRTGVEHVLANPFYCGIIRLQSSCETFTAIHEPLISVSLFQAAQDVKAGRTAKRVTRREHTYRGLFRCAHCNSAMTPELQKGHVYYRCHTPDCLTTTTREEMIERKIERLLATACFDDDQLAKMESYIFEWFAGKTASSDRPALKLRMSQLDRRVERLTDALIDQHIDPDTFARRKEALMLERAGIEEELANSEKSKRRREDLREFLELAKNLGRTYEMANSQERRQIVELTTSNRVVMGRNPSVEPRNWLKTLQIVGDVSSGAHHRDTSRTTFHRIDEHAAGLTEMLLADEVACLKRLVSTSEGA